MKLPMILATCSVWVLPDTYIKRIIDADYLNYLLNCTEILLFKTGIKTTFINKYILYLYIYIIINIHT